MAAKRAPRGRKAEEAQAEQAPATSPAAAATRTSARTVVGVAEVVPATRLSAWPRA